MALNSSLSYVVKFAEPIANNVLAKRVLDSNIGFAAETGSIDEIELVDQQFKIDAEAEKLILSGIFYTKKLNDVVALINLRDGNTSVRK